MISERVDAARPVAPHDALERLDFVAGEQFDIFAVQRKYLDIVREFGFKLPEDYLSFEPQVRRLQQVLRASAGPAVPCHNDLLAANIMDADSQIRFVDFEYSGNNDPCFELGNIWSEAALSTDHVAHLVAAYHGSESTHLVARARLFGLIAKYGWTLWASIQHAVSDVDFGFWSWGMEKYARAVAEFRGTEFERLVTAAELPHSSNRPHAAIDDRHTQ